nr:probable glutathione peroxidase 2 [Ipomoea batatas]
MAADSPKSIFDFSVKDIRGNDVPLSNYRGKVVLIVNVASKCGLTNSNYKELNILYDKYKDQGFEILAFPCNQFAWQEPGTNEEIQETVCTRFKAEFPIFEKIDVNGKNIAPLYKYLKSEKGGVLGDSIKWNFTKFLVNREGKVVERYGPSTSPLKFEKDIENLLGSPASTQPRRLRARAAKARRPVIPALRIRVGVLEERGLEEKRRRRRRVLKVECPCFSLEMAFRLQW